MRIRHDHYFHFDEPVPAAALDRIEQIVNQVRAQQEVILVNEADALSKLREIETNLEEISGDLEELKNHPDVTPAVSAELDSLISRTRAVADVVPEADAGGGGGETPAGGGGEDTGGGGTEPTA